MNIYTMEIAEILKVDMQTAMKVQDEMEIRGIDFSECTNAEFKREAKSAYSEIKKA